MEDIKETLEPTVVGMAAEVLAIQKLIWRNNIRRYVKQRENIAENFQNAYNLIYRQYYEYMSSKLEAHPD